MKAKELRKIFHSQLSELYRPDQELTFLRIHWSGEMSVMAINFWRLGSLVEEFDYVKEDQKGHILPVFRDR